MSNRELAKRVYWVGAVDWDIRDFHGYSTNRGSTYNAFLIVDEKITLVDTVKRNHLGQLIENIKRYIDPTKIDYIIVNHVELDHSGSLSEMIKLVNPEKVFCSPMGEKALKDHFHDFDWPLEIVKTGHEISLGKKTIQFIETRMLHWPDSMFSFIKEDGILFSSDAFGQHYASLERFDDEADMPAVMHEATKYYANILYLFSPLIKKLLQTITDMNLDIKIIAPDHGIIWRSHLDKILTSYSNWANGKSEKKAVIIYDTMWNSTEKMARAVGNGLEEKGVPVKLINLKCNHRSDAITDVLESRAVILGSSTLNNGFLPRMASFVTYMKGLKPINKIGAAFGSFGWSGEAVKHLNDIMGELKFDLIEEGYRIKYIPTDANLEECTEMGKRIGQAILEDNNQ